MRYSAHVKGRTSVENKFLVMIITAFMQQWMQHYGDNLQRNLKRLKKERKNTIILSSNAISMTVAGKQNTMRQQKRDGNQKAQKQCETGAANS